MLSFPPLGHAAKSLSLTCIMLEDPGTFRGPMSPETCLNFSSISSDMGCNCMPSGSGPLPQALQEPGLQPSPVGLLAVPKATHCMHFPVQEVQMYQNASVLRKRSVCNIIADSHSRTREAAGARRVGHWLAHGRPQMLNVCKACDASFRNAYPEIHGESKRRWQEEVQREPVQDADSAEIAELICMLKIRLWRQQFHILVQGNIFPFSVCVGAPSSLLIEV